MLSINLSTPNSMMERLKEKYRQLRLSYDLTQEGLAKKSGVSLGSIKRFENSGQISLQSLLKLSVVLQCLDDFENIADVKESINSLDELLENRSTKTKKRGKIK